MDFAVAGSIFAQEFESLSDISSGSGTIQASIDIWVGFEEQPDGTVCVWAGNEFAGICVSDCESERTNEISTATAEVVASRLVEELQTAFDENKYDILLTVAVVILTAVLIAAILWAASAAGYSVILGGAAAA